MNFRSIIVFFLFQQPESDVHVPPGAEGRFARAAAA
jgi:hypothetical protein